MLIHTAEIRWFAQGELPEDVAAWFDRGGPALSFPPRTDRYLVLPGSDYVGIKIREGRFEVKARVGGDSPVRLDGGSNGTLEHWVKWIAPFSPEPSWIQSAASVEVTKTRALRGYQAGVGGVEVVDASRVEAWTDCRADLARIEVAGEAWWSLAFEAAGQPADLGAALRHALEAVFNERPPPFALVDRGCRSYPAFLQRFAV